MSGEVEIRVTGELAISRRDCVGTHLTSEGEEKEGNLRDLERIGCDIAVLA